MVVKLARLTFDVANGRALHVRQDRLTPAAANVGAFALSTTVRQRLAAEAVFTFEPQAGVASPATIEVRARPVSSELGVLGSVAPMSVDVPRGGATSTPVAVQFPSAQIHDAGVGRYDVSWNWEFRTPGTTAWAHFDTTAHVIYVTLAPPGPPWTQAIDAASQGNWPWTRFLDFACASAGGVTLARGMDAASKTVAQKIESAIFAMGEQELLAYDQGNSANFIIGTTPKVFNATRFLDLLEGSAGERPMDIFCSECATAVALVANALGLDLKLFQVRRKDSLMMELNRVVTIGNRRDRSPSFSFHEATVRTSASGSEQVFDGCLQPDWDTNLDNDVHDFRLTQGRRLGALRLNPEGSTYLHRLLEPRETVWDQLEIVQMPMPHLDVRPLGFEPVIGLDDKLKSVLRQRIDANSPQMPVAAPVPVVIPPFKLKGFRVYKQADTMSHLEELRPLVSNYKGFAYTAFRPDQQGPDFDPNRRFRISVAWSPSANAAREAMAWLMSRIDRDLRPLKKAGKKPLGDVAFSTRDQRTVFILRDNAFARLVSTGRKIVPMGPIAESLDRAFLKMRKAGQLTSIAPGQ